MQPMKAMKAMKDQKAMKKMQPKKAMKAMKDQKAPIDTKVSGRDGHAGEGIIWNYASSRFLACLKKI